MKRMSVVLIFGTVLLLTIACTLSQVTNPPKKDPVRLETAGDRTSFSDEYSCVAIDSVLLIIDEDGVATLTTTGPVFVDHINCKKDPSGFEATYVLVGLADDEKRITFTNCNDGGFNAEGSISYRTGVPVGTVSCIYTKGDDAGKTTMTLFVPSVHYFP